jgi:hypothetical protein
MKGLIHVYIVAFKFNSVKIKIIYNCLMQGLMQGF